MLFTSCRSRINNTQVCDAQYVDGVIPMYSFIENSNNNSKTLGYYGNIAEMNQLLLIMTQLLIFLKLILLMIC